MVSASETATALIDYMSQNLLKVAELNSVLDQFGGSKPLPASGKRIVFVPHSIEPDITQASKVSYKIRYKAVVANRDWIRALYGDGGPNKLNEPHFNVIEPFEYDFGRFDFGAESGPLAVRELSAADRTELEKML